MNLRPRRDEVPEINLTPLIDVVFLLLIFFMVTTTFERQARLKVDLPEASPAAAQAQVETLEIVINARGRYYVNGVELPASEPDALRRALAGAAGEERSRPVTIRADAQAPHQSVVTAMDVLGRMGFVNLSIATTPGSGD